MGWAAGWHLLTNHTRPERPVETPAEVEVKSSSVTAGAAHKWLFLQPVLSSLLVRRVEPLRQPLMVGLHPGVGKGRGSAGDNGIKMDSSWEQWEGGVTH